VAIPPSGSPDDDDIDGACAVDTFRLRQAILANKFMLQAYAAAVVILAVGLVLLTITLAVLCFFYPNNANAFLILLGGPAAAVIVHNGLQLKRIVKNGNAGSSTHRDD
jgi:hypothetical protein